MKIRTDLTAYSLTGLCVVALVTLAVAGRDVPALLETITLVTLGVSGGAAVPTVLGGRTSTPTPEPAPAPAPASRALDYATYEATRDDAKLPTPRPAVINDFAAYDAAQQPEPAAAVPGRDWTETFPAITPEQIAAHRAGRQ